MSRKFLEYPNLPDMSGNSVWDNNSAVRLKIRMHYILKTYGMDEHITFDWKEMTPEECGVIFHITTQSDDIDNMKGKSIEQAAKEENGTAMLLLAQDYLLKGDTETAMEWAQRAELNLTCGVYGFEGFLYFKNNDLPKAKECFEMGAYVADPVSMRFLGYMYKLGLGLEKNLQLSHDYLECSAALGDTDAKDALQKWSADYAQ